MAEASIYAFLAEVVPDAIFADRFPLRRSRPSTPPQVAATVMVLQSLEYRRGATAGRWGIHPTMLTASDRPERIFDAVRDVVAETGLLVRSTRRALDSTVLQDAVATQDTATQLVAQIRRVRKMAPAADEVELPTNGPDHRAHGRHELRRTAHIGTARSQREHSAHRWIQD